jgi:exonuclease III
LDGGNEFRQIDVMNGSSKDVTRLKYVRSWYTWLKPVNATLNSDDFLNLFPDNADIVTWIKIIQFRLGRTLQVTIQGQDTNLRSAPSLKGSVIHKLAVGDTVKLMDGPIQVNGYSWWKMQVNDKDATEGWAVENHFWFDPAK